MTRRYFTLTFKLPPGAQKIAAYTEVLEASPRLGIASVSRRRSTLELSFLQQADCRRIAVAESAEAAIIAILRAGLKLDVEDGKVVKFDILKSQRKVATGACLILPVGSPHHRGLKRSRKCR